MSTTEKFIGESKVIDAPSKKVVFKIADRAVSSSKIAEEAVTTEKIAPQAVSMNNLSEDVQLAMQSVERGQLALAQGPGQSTVIGISQKGITDLFASIPTVEGDYHDE